MHLIRSEESTDENSTCFVCVRYMYLTHIIIISFPIINLINIRKAISNILDQAINIDSKQAPKQLTLLLQKENPLWKLPERRVARYLKRHLKARKVPQADEIEADLDEMTVFTAFSPQGSMGDLNSPGLSLSSPPEKGALEKSPRNLNDDMIVEGDDAEDEVEKNLYDVDAFMNETVEAESNDPYATKNDDTDKGLICCGMPCVIS